MAKSEIKNFKHLLDVYSMFLSSGYTFTQEEKSPHEKLGDGYELRPIDITIDNKLIENTSKYSNLYKDGVKVCDKIFRKGGFGGKTKDGYIELIHYIRETNKEKSDRYGFSFGKHVIINTNGDIVLEGKNSLDYPYHYGGNIGHLNNELYDLRTGTIIAPKCSNTITGKNSIIIEHRYDFTSKFKLPLGIYKIDLFTCELTKIDEIK